MRTLLSASASLAVLLGMGAGVAASSLPTASHAQVGFGVTFNVRVGPPALPVYTVPPSPGFGYFWTPGYWAWNATVGDYYWVPGVWVRPPSVGLLWTPGYWGWNNGFYGFHAGYWGPHVGYYGGVNYGFGYSGVGFVGGAWRGGRFVVNRAVIENVTVNNVSRVSYAGGPGGTTATPTAVEMAATNERHVAPTAEQVAHVQAAATEPGNRFGVNRGRPAVAATATAGVLKGPGVVAARGAPLRAPTGRAPMAKTPWAGHPAAGRPTGPGRNAAGKPNSF